MQGWCIIPARPDKLPASLGANVHLCRVPEVRHPLPGVQDITGRVWESSARDGAGGVYTGSYQLSGGPGYGPGEQSQEQKENFHDPVKVNLRGYQALLGVVILCQDPPNFLAVSISLWLSTCWQQYFDLEFLIFVWGVGSLTFSDCLSLVQWRSVICCKGHPTPPGRSLVRCQARAHSHLWCQVI